MSHISRNNKRYAVSNLPAVPRLLVELLDLCHDDEAGFESFSSIIEQDAALAARILHYANTPLFYQWKDIGDLRRMLIVLGLSNVKTIVTTCALEQFFSQFNNDVNQQVEQVWIRSVFCANLCERLAKLLAYHKPGEAFLAGLLHQVGILVLLRNTIPGYLPLLEQYHDNPQAFCRREQELLATDHCEIGAALAETWQLDSFIADAIGFQHAHVDELQSAPTLLKILAIGSSFNCGPQPRQDPAALSRAAQLLSLTAETTLSCIEEAREKTVTMLTTLGLANARTLLGEYQATGTLAEDTEAADNLRQAVRRVTLAQAAATAQSADLETFARQVRVSFSCIFPLRQLLLLTYDSAGAALKPVNDLNLQQLAELSWSTQDNKSQVVQAFHGATIMSLEPDTASITDRQLLRLLDSPSVSLLPLVQQGKSLALLAFARDDRQEPLSATDRALLKLFGSEIARRYAAISDMSGSAFSMTATDFRQLVHEVSNPLSIINNYLYILGKKLQDEDPAQTELRAIAEEIDRVGRILLHARDSDRGADQGLRPTDINQLIRSLDRMMANSLYKTGQIRSVLQLDDKIPAVLCAADKLKQVLLNLTKNAAEALPPGGTIETSTRDGIFQNQQSYVEITVRDNGPGIDPAILPQLFSPVSSTKAGHSGLGLTVVNNLIKEMGGSISCCSTATGTEFKILLPRRTSAQ
jgi:HD-like signal output (HDOD) protein/nitrogen-specific signal transduction histidine kinase